MKKYIAKIIPLLVVILLLSILPTTVHAAAQTEVTFRMSLNEWGNYASANIYLYHYASPDDDQPLDDVKTFPMYRVAKWEATEKVEPGYYVAVAYPTNAMAKDHHFTPMTDLFEVTGEKMTVYICVDIDDKIAPKPDQWLVYGDDPQDFFIWGGPEDPDNRFTETSDPGDEPSSTTDPEGEKIPEIDTEVVPAHRHETTTDPVTPTTDVPSNPPEEKLSAKIGTYIFYAIIGVAGVGGAIALYIMRKRRGA